MSDFLGSRISLISKSDIRYSGILHEINSGESTVSLKNVRSFGTEGRRGNSDEEIPPSDQVYEFIVFRGSDVKDLRIEEGPAKENDRPPVPNDPAIMSAHPRAGVAPPGAPPGAPGAPSTGPAFGPGPGPMYYPPPGNWGRGGPPGPSAGPGFGGMNYPPPWMHPGQHPGPNYPPGPGPWNNYYQPGPPVPPGPAQMNRSGQETAQEKRPTPIGGGPDASKANNGAAQSELPAEQKSLSQGPTQSAPVPPVESKPSVEEVKATAATISANGQGDLTRPHPSTSKNTKVTPAVPALPILSTHSHETGAGLQAGNDASNAAAIRDATQAAKAAVAVAMSKLDGQQNVPSPLIHSHGNPMDNLAQKVDEMRVNASARSSAGRGRGRGGGTRSTKVEVPDSDFDFASSNAKFNKGDLVKEAVAGSPLSEPVAGTKSIEEPESEPAPQQAYNKSRSFFDNISSEAKERADNTAQKPGGREWRGEEQRRNMETFGQGSVDGGYRFRGRGRGRGRSGRGRGRGGGGGFRGHSDGAVATQ